MAIRRPVDAQVLENAERLATLSCSQINRQSATPITVAPTIAAGAVNAPTVEDRRFFGSFLAAAHERDPSTTEMFLVCSTTVRRRLQGE
jgi:hypothetical protein